MKMSEWKQVDLPPIEFYKTGLHNFDELANGIPKNEITLISGGTGVGKSYVLLHLATVLAKENKVLYLSLENSPQTEINRNDFIFKMNEYNIKEEECDFEYVNANFEVDENGEDLSILKIIEKYLEKLPKYDIMCIDAMETSIDGSEDGSALYRNGNLIMKKLKKELKELNNQGDFSKSIIISWQMNRDANVKKIDDFTLYSIASSMGIARYAATIYGVVDINKSKYLKCLKARHGYKSVKRYIDIQDGNGNINLHNATSIEEGNDIINDLYETLHKEE